MSVINILDWSQAFTAGVGACGGKGWNLARLDKYGFLIPNGGILSSTVYQQLISHPDIVALIKKLQHVDDEQLTSESCSQLLSKIRQNIHACGLPETLEQTLNNFLNQQHLLDTSLSVRSSATLEDSKTASFAGIHDSYLNIKGITNIKQAILNCFASLWTSRAVSYRRKMKIDDQELSCAVVIMSLVDAKSSGIAFSCDPGTGREDISVINANYGLGESVVGGVIEPDEYQLNSHHATILKIKTGSKTKRTQINNEGGTHLVKSANSQDKQVLTDEQINHLGRLIQRVFWALGNGEHHQDIEWAFDGQTFFLLQARPVTALPRLTYDVLKDQQDTWSNGNFRDAAPMVQSTLGSSVLPHYIDAILSAPFKYIGYHLPEGLSFVKLFQGRAYFNVSLVQWVYYDSTGYPPASTNRNIGGHQPEIKIDDISRGSYADKILRVWRMIKLMRQMNSHKKEATKRITKETIFTNSIIHSDLSSLTDKELASSIQQCDQRLDAYTLPFAMLGSLSGSVVALFDMLDKRMPGKGTAVANALLAGASDITSANHGYQLQNLASLVDEDPDALEFFNSEPFIPDAWHKLDDSSPFKRAFQEFINEYGHRAVYEGDITNPRWREVPDYLLNVIKQSIGNRFSSSQEKQQSAKAKQAWKTVKTSVPFYQRPIIRSLVKQSAEGAALREMAKSHWIRLLEPARLLFLEAGERLKSRGLLKNTDDIFHCAYTEVTALLNAEWNGNGLKSLIDSRHSRKLALEKLSPPDIILGDKPQYSRPANFDSGNTLSGMGVSAGRANGHARLIRTPEEGVSLNKGDVLVAPSTDPAWTPLFLNAAAIVVETGGQLSHGAIVAREYGIPTVLNIPGLFQVITDGERIAVDGDRGIIEKLSTAK